MKKLLLLLLLFTGMVNAQIVNIPDANFKAKLLSASSTTQIAQNSNNQFVSVDLNSDGEIQVSEAENILSLTISYSNIASMVGIQSFINLNSLYCDGNFVSNLDLSGLLNLNELVCAYCQISSLNLSGLYNLNSLNCQFNNLVSLDLSDLLNLTNLECRYNQLTSLNLSQLISLISVSCTGNQLSTLDLSNNSNLISLDCINNQLITINIKNGGITTDFYFYFNPNLTFICADEQEVNVIQFVIDNQFGVSTTCNVNSYCNFTPGGNYNTITGIAKYDGNNNGCDALDLPQPNIRININDGTNQGATFTNNLGNYKFYTQIGNFSLTPSIENSTWFNFSPITATIPFANNNNNLATQDFCITANGIHNDLEIVVSPYTPARPGFDAVCTIVYKNKGNQTLSGNFNFTFNDAVLDYVTSTVAPNSQTTGNLNWNYTNLLPFESRSFNVTLNVNAPNETPAVNIGDVLNFNVSISPSVGDEIPSDNSFTYNQIVVGPFDPNDITCLEGESVSPSTIGEYLHYAINFENTGNYPAENVVVKTTINSANFDINSLQLLTTSNPVYAKITGNVVEFIFQNINLSGGGHGHILLKIKSNATLVTGDIVSKRADIFFDYNAPIDTGMASTTFAALNNGSFELDKSISIYPNPTNSIINIKSDTEIKNIQLYDIQGRILQTTLGNSNTIDISDKNSGIYFLKITTDKGSKVEKISKE